MFFNEIPDFNFSYLFFRLGPEQKCIETERPRFFARTNLYFKIHPGFAWERYLLAIFTYIL